MVAETAYHAKSAAKKATVEYIIEAKKRKIKMEKVSKKHFQWKHVYKVAPHIYSRSKEGSYFEALVVSKELEALRPQNAQVHETKYRIVEEKVQWEQARDRCYRMGGELVSV